MRKSWANLQWEDPTPLVGLMQKVIITWPQQEPSQSMTIEPVARSKRTALSQVGQADGVARRVVERRTP